MKCAFSRNINKLLLLLTKIKKQACKITVSTVSPTIFTKDLNVYAVSCGFFEIGEGHEVVA